MGNGHAHCEPEDAIETSNLPADAGETKPSRHALPDTEESPMVVSSDVETMATATPVLPYPRKRTSKYDECFWPRALASCRPCSTCCDERAAYIDVDAPLHMVTHVEPPQGDNVFVNVYDLNEKVQCVNTVSLGLGLGGVLHVGVEIADREWSYSMSGVLTHLPREHPVYILRQTLDMGRTPYSRLEVRCVLREMRAKWRGEDYDLLERNCGTFGNALCEALHVGSLPSWVNRLATASGKLPAARTITDYMTPDRQAIEEAMRANMSRQTEGTAMRGGCPVSATGDSRGDSKQKGFGGDDNREKPRSSTRDRPLCESVEFSLGGGRCD